jgi:hypothetical protein
MKSHVMKSLKEYDKAESLWRQGQKRMRKDRSARISKTKSMPNSVAMVEIYDSTSQSARLQHPPDAEN